MRITLAQVGGVLGDVEANLDRAEQAVANAVEEGSELIVFPELHLSGYSIGLIDEDLSLRADDRGLRRIAKRAGDAGVVLGFVEDGPGVHTYNSAAYFQDGHLVHVHRKLYLPTYTVFEERKHFTPGPSLRAFPAAEDTRMAILVCNDAWQPQLAFLATQDGALVLLVPASSAQSQFPERYDSKTYWRDITRFYARMFQLYVVFVNRVGTEGDLHFWGGSHVVDPWGEIIAEAPEDVEHLLTVDIDLTDVRRRRRAIPLVKEARLALINREVHRLLDEGGDQ
ncbi:nitrilase-related carbon-nitrogen hydrolase [Pseudonocardia asaccharolytica]|uniref:Carbon-nitrogen hydrolase n=1 Tax=Pseudonocardia asaccharolytica DSM 44247 = NBRC 16224 TaxID=1123024 RepID=A0A511D6Y1_9PSEU|nr:nitrilase-related carbon-nitrogen hydrolase [Pseudonocardia asaccharolytica]GEL20512.1 carbon-nitrogen hydrolase [Pseudonocardia asaccharolytica DSM 44247 = NBRC 16224]